MSGAPGLASSSVVVLVERLRAAARSGSIPPEHLSGVRAVVRPDVATGLELVEKTAGTAPWLRDIHVYNPGGFASTGLPLGDVPGMRGYVPAIVRRISEDLVLADLPLHEARTRAEVPPDFGPELYAGALWQGETRLRAVTHLDVSRKQIDAAVEAFARLCKRGSLA